MAKSYRELKVWEKSIDLTVLVYELTEGFPRNEVFGLTSQMRRAPVSIASNIAEGSVRGTRRDFRQFVKVAHGSNCELQTQMIIAGRLGFGSEENRVKAELLSQEIGKMLSGLGQYLTDRIRLEKLKTDH